MVRRAKVFRFPLSELIRSKVKFIQCLLQSLVSKFDKRLAQVRQFFFREV